MLENIPGGMHSGAHRGRTQNSAGGGIQRCSLAIPLATVGRLADLQVVVSSSWRQFAVDMGRTCSSFVDSSSLGSDCSPLKALVIMPQCPTMCTCKDAVSSCLACFFFLAPLVCMPVPSLDLDEMCYVKR